jgi:hypothetical protein
VLGNLRGVPEAGFRNVFRHVMIRVMKKRKCAVCKQIIQPVRGRPPRYCSAACRQKAYRRRLADPSRVPLRLLQNDIDHMQARVRLVRGLERLGYKVTLERIAMPSKEPPPRLRVVNAFD